MELRRYGALALKWWWLLCLCTALAGGASWYASRSQPRVYEASALLLVQQAQDIRGIDYNSLLTSERLARTYAELLRQETVLAGAIQKLGLTITPDALEKSVNVRIIRDTQLIEVSVEDESAAQARDLANTIAETFIEQRKVERQGQSSTSREVLKAQIADLEREITETSTALERARSASPAAQAEVGRLQSLLAQHQVTYSQLVRSEQDMVLAEARASTSLRVAEPARLPRVPVRPKVAQNTLLAAFLGLVLAVAVAFVVEYLDDTVKGDADVQTATGGLSTLGVIARVHRRQADQGPRIVDTTARSGVAEGYRVLRTNIDFAWAGAPGRAVMVTSANPKEGKTTTVANLAVVMAEDRRRVVAVDADLRRPSLHRALGVTAERGLTNLLADPDADVAEYLIPTKMSNLWVIPSGPIPPNPSELLGSPRFGALIEELKQHADIVLVDTPPVLAVADPAIVQARVDGVILVAEAGRTRMEALAHVVDVLAKGSARRLGVVLNKVGEGSRYYHHYYYYYYHREYTQEPTSPNGSAKERRSSRA